MTEQRDAEDGIGYVPANDHRPQSGLREGDISHAEVNEAIGRADKTVIFGQQTRLRLGLLMEDESLPRFHAGHDMVKFFYGAIRQIPEVFLDGILGAGISVTLVRESELLVFRGPREHQSFHTGRTRRTIYMPEQVVKSAFEKGYDYWALSEVIIQEAWALLDYLLILELVRRVQVKLREVHLPGISYIKGTLRELNHHLKDPSERLRQEGWDRQVLDAKEDEFMLFYGTYCGHFKAWNRSILDRDPYDIADEVFDEGVERQWAAWKVDSITHTFNYPTYFQLDRDIVHPAAFELAESQSMPLAPVTVEDVIHDLGDMARFRVGRQVKTEPLLDRLIEFGAPGILAFARLIARERAFGNKVVTHYYYDGYDAVRRFREKLQAFSSDDPPDLGVGLAFDRLVTPMIVALAREQMEHFRSLSDLEQGEWRLFLRQFVFELIGACGPPMSDADKELMLVTPAHYTPSQQAAAWLDVAEGLLPEGEGESEGSAVANILQELRRHPQYHGLFLEQARELSHRQELTFGADLREEMAQLIELIPEPAYKYSSEPQAVRRRVDELQRLRVDDPDSDEQYILLASILVRLDLASNYEDLVGLVRRFGEAVNPMLEEVIESIGERDVRRGAIRQTAAELLGSSR